MFENPTTSAHKDHVRFYSTELWRRIDSNALFKVPAPAPAAPAAPVPPSDQAATATSSDWVWEETTHWAHQVGHKIEIVTAFKPKYKDFVGSDAVIRKIVAKKIAPDKYKDYIFFVEVEGKDEAETEKFRDAIRRLNKNCFTDILDRNSRSLVPCRMSHICCVSRLRRERAAMASLSGASSSAASSTDASKRPLDDPPQDDAGASKKPRLEQPPPALDEVKLGDRVEILKTLYIMKEFVGYHGVVRKILKRESFTSCWVEITHNSIGLPAPTFLAEDVRKKNSNFYSEPELWISWVCCRVENVVLAEPGLPDPFTEKSWAALSVRDRKMHRQRLHKHGAAKKEVEDKTSSSLLQNDTTVQTDTAIQSDISIGDYVEVLQGLKPYIGYYGVVRKIRTHDVDTLTCFVELQCNPAGQAVKQDELSDITKMNRILSLREANSSPLLSSSLLYCNTFNVVLVDQPKPPAPWTPETWARLPFGDRKAHRQKQQQDKTAAPQKEAPAKPVSKLDMLFDAALAEWNRLEKTPRDIAVGDTVQINRIVYKDWYPADFVGFYGVVRSIQKNYFHTKCFVELTHDTAGVPITPEHTSTVEDWNKGMYDSKDKAFMKCNIEYIALADPKVPRPASDAPVPTFQSSKLHRDRVRHRKYNPIARAPWRGGEVQPYLYGRRVVFILNGERGESITR
jgi:hypothetical protein